MEDRNLVQAHQWHNAVALAMDKVAELHDEAKDLARKAEALRMSLWSAESYLADLVANMPMLDELEYKPLDVLYDDDGLAIAFRKEVFSRKGMLRDMFYNDDWRFEDGLIFDDNNDPVGLKLSHYRTLYNSIRTAWYRPMQPSDVDGTYSFYWNPESWFPMAESEDKNQPHAYEYWALVY